MDKQIALEKKVTKRFVILNKGITTPMITAYFEFTKEQYTFLKAVFDEINIVAKYAGEPSLLLVSYEDVFGERSKESEEIYKAFVFTDERTR